MDVHKLYVDSIKTRDLRKRLSKYLADLDLVYGEFEILYMLNNKLPHQPSQIGKGLSCEPAGVSRILRSLLFKNLVTYINDKHDRRKVLVGLTNRGKIKIESVLELNQ